jgi:peroxiredoxin
MVGGFSCGRCGARMGQSCLSKTTMALTPSTMLPLGTPAPDFSLPDVLSGETVSLAALSHGKALLVMFICEHCPFVKHVEQELASLGQDYQDQPLALVAISANSLQTHPQDGPAQLKAQAQRLGFMFPYLFDADQGVAKAYRAACTPDFFLFRKGISRDNSEVFSLVYRGQLDDSRPSNGQPVTGRDLRQAIEAALAGQPMVAEQKPSIGCNIKWTPGNEPAYFGV